MQIGGIHSGGACTLTQFSYFIHFALFQELFPRIHVRKDEENRMWASIQIISTYQTAAYLLSDKLHFLLFSFCILFGFPYSLLIADVGSMPCLLGNCEEHSK